MVSAETARAIGEARTRLERASLAVLRPDTRVIAIETNGRQLTVRVYQNGPLTDEAYDELERALSEAMAGLEQPAGPPVEYGFSLNRQDHPATIPVMGDVIFARSGTGMRAWREGDR